MYNSTKYVIEQYYKSIKLIEDDVERLLEQKIQLIKEVEILKNCSNETFEIFEIIRSANHNNHCYKTLESVEKILNNIRFNNKLDRELDKPNVKENV